MIEGLIDYKTIDPQSRRDAKEVIHLWLWETGITLKDTDHNRLVYLVAWLNTPKQ